MNITIVIVFLKGNHFFKILFESFDLFFGFYLHRIVVIIIIIIMGVFSLKLVYFYAFIHFLTPNFP